MSKQRSTGRLERRAEREAKDAGAATPRPARRRTQPQTRNVDTGPKFLPPFLRNLSTTQWGIAGIGLFVLVFLIYAITQTGQGASQPGWYTSQLDDDPDLPGVYYAPHPGPDGVANTVDDRQHYGNGTVIPICTDAQLESGNITNPLCYTSNPPTSGPHVVSPMPFRNLDNPAPKENLVHNMEHGGIVIWYNTTDEEMIKKIRDLAQEQIDRRRFVVTSAYPEMEANTIAVTAWTRMDKFPIEEWDSKRVTDFISEHHKRFNPEGF